MLGRSLLPILCCLLCGTELQNAYQCRTSRRCYWSPWSAGFLLALISQSWAGTGYRGHLSGISGFCYFFPIIFEALWLRLIASRRATSVPFCLNFPGQLEIQVYFGDSRFYGDVSPRPSSLPHVLSHSPFPSPFVICSAGFGPNRETQ